MNCVLEGQFLEVASRTVQRDGQEKVYYAVKLLEGSDRVNSVNILPEQKGLFDEVGKFEDVLLRVSAYPQVSRGSSEAYLRLVFRDFYE